jgi:hypothetical protein
MLAGRIAHGTRDGSTAGSRFRRRTAAGGARSWRCKPGRCRSTTTSTWTRWCLRRPAWPALTWPASPPRLRCWRCDATTTRVCRAGSTRDCSAAPTPAPGSNLSRYAHHHSFLRPNLPSSSAPVNAPPSPSAPTTGCHPIASASPKGATPTPAAPNTPPSHERRAPRRPIVSEARLRLRTGATSKEQRSRYGRSGVDPRLWNASAKRG